jgi:proline dehydrogenase
MYIMQAAHSESYDPGLMERLLFRVAKKWVAGHSQHDAVKAALDANSRGIFAIVNFLGEEVLESKQVDVTVGEYLSLMDLLGEKGVEGCVSVKPTQVGLAIDYDTCLQNFKQLATRAKSLGQFLWLDMESVRFTEQTVTIYLELLKDYDQVGVAIQAYLKRSASDLLHILENDGKVRLVKGAYHEGEEHVFSSKEQVGQNYLYLLDVLAKSGNFFAVATHDSVLIKKAVEMGGKVEFQMLMGIRDELKSELVAKNLLVAEYIPYGSQWLPYSVRRIRERKRNLILLARSLV